MALAEINYYKLKKIYAPPLNVRLAVMLSFCFLPLLPVLTKPKTTFHTCVRILNDWKAESLDVEPGTNTK